MSGQTTAQTAVQQGPSAHQETAARSLRPLARILPYMLRYKGLLAGAAFFLLLAAGTTLALPLAVRRMIDYGFSGNDAALINQYFSMMIIIAVLLGFVVGYLVALALGALPSEKPEAGREGRALDEAPDVTLRIIEGDLGRAEAAAERLRRSVVLQGDGMSLDLMAEAGVLPLILPGADPGDLPDLVQVEREYGTGALPAFPRRLALLGPADPVPALRLSRDEGRALDQIAQALALPPALAATTLGVFVGGLLLGLALRRPSRW